MLVTIGMKRFSKWLKTASLDTKDYQIEGMRWILERETNPDFGPCGGFLCDEMGLGKTILMLGTIISNFKGKSGNCKTLIVLPLAILEQWRSVILKFLGHDALVYHGQIVKKIDLDLLRKSPIVLTTYGMISTRKKVGYKSKLWDVAWNRIIFDEAHHMRNKKNRIFAGAMKLTASIKWLVTGTPINNRINDFYNLCRILGFDTIRSQDEEENIISSCVLKRTKKQVGISMPTLTITKIPVHFASKEEELLARNIHSLLDFATITPQNVDRAIQMLSMNYDSPLPLYMLMREVCVMPELAINMLKKRAVMHNWDVNGDEFPIKSVSTHSKISAVVDQVMANKSTNKGKIIFCQFRREIQKLYDELTARGMTCAIMNGSTPKKERNRILKAPLVKKDWQSIFHGNKTLWPQSDTISELIAPWLTYDVLILQIQTACEGLNLQHYAEIYFTTPHWNPAVEDQAIARAHRIGQKKPVNVYKFVTTFSKIDGESDQISLDQYCANVQNVKRKVQEKIS